MADKKLNSHVRFYIGLLIVCFLFSMPNLHAKPNPIAVKLLAFCLDTWGFVEKHEKYICVDGKSIQVRSYWYGTLVKIVYELASVDENLSQEQKDELSRISLFAYQTINPIIDGKVDSLWQHMASWKRGERISVLPIKPAVPPKKALPELTVNTRL